MRPIPTRSRTFALSSLVLGLVLAVFCACATGKATREEIDAGRERYAALLEANDLEPDARHEVRLDVYKADRRLELVVEDKVVATYDIGLGWEPEGDKEVEGDGRTPIGEYHVVTRHSSKFHLFLGLDYPNADDVARALEAGRIDERTARKVLAKLEDGARPPWDTEMGGAIGVHGGGGTFDWTAGCIAVDNDEIEVIYAAARMGTTIMVYP